MPRYRQIKTDDGYKLVEITNDRAARARIEISKAGAFEPFKSVVDGSIVDSRRALHEHNVRNNVVHESEYGSQRDRESFWEHKAKERADLYEGTTRTAYGRKLKQERIQTIVEAFAKHERS